ncbi:MAG TPA: hypothetical protein VIM85_06340 [Pseudomonadales bacterium]
MKPAYSSSTNTYLDSKHSTSLRNLLAATLFAGVAQVLLIQIIPLYVYIGLVSLSAYLLFGKNKVARKLKGIDSNQFAQSTQHVEQKIKSRIRYLTSNELRKKNTQQSYTKTSFTNIQEESTAQKADKKNFSTGCSIIDFPVRS